MSNFDRTPFIEAREDIRDLVSMPLQAWLMIPPARRRDVAYDNIIAIPIDLAAAEYAVTVMQSETGWSIDVTKMITPRCKLHLAGRARSYVSALYQLADSADLRLRDLERQAKAEHENARKNEVAA